MKRTALLQDKLRGTTLLVEDDYDACDVDADFDHDPRLGCDCGMRVEIPAEVDVDFTADWSDEEDAL